ncbi:RNA polymerase subunit sigma-70 [Duganella sp. Leaf61]|uniref:anti-sigma factor n=1 Tax=Duganella sp. Leaf61 TaxID=1736227 RepID=UPI0006F57D01|nr:anti-sigma factor [Duganella sp. Leaf61]KQN79202.1 RNA polymerase subunit sigma-70 [Duganella sp. Leaf61]
MTESIETLRELAGEYVLGTLPLAARQDIERRLALEPLLRAEVAAWEQRLLPLTALAEPTEPSPELWPKISNSVAGSRATAAADQSVNKLASSLTPSAVTAAGGWRRWWDDLRVWRALSGGAVFATLVLAVLLTRQPSSEALQPAYMVVLVAPQERTAGYVVQASLNRKLTLTPLHGVAVPGNKSLQFWTKGTDWKAPVSLGLVRPNQSVKLTLDQLPQVQQDQLFEITLEPEAGSPTGKPTGPILYIGRAVKVAM